MDERVSLRLYPEIIRVLSRGQLAEIVGVLDVMNTKIDTEDPIKLDSAHDDLETIGRELVGAQPPFLEPKPKKGMHWKPNSALDYDDEGEWYPAVIIDLTLVGIIRII